VLTEEVIKREILEGDKAVDAKRRLAKAAAKALRKVEKADEPASGTTPIDAPAPQVPSANAAVAQG